MKLHGKIKFLTPKCVGHLLSDVKIYDDAMVLTYILCDLVPILKDDSTLVLSKLISNASESARG